MGSPGRNGLICRMILISLIIPTAVFLIINSVASADIIHTLSKGYFASVGIGVVVAYAPGLWLMMRDGYLSRGLLLSMGIIELMLFLVAHQLYHWYWRLTGEDLNVINSSIVAWFVIMMGCAGVFILTAPGVIEETVPRRSWIILGAWVSAGMAMAMTALFFYERSFFYSRFGAIFG